MGEVDKRTFLVINDLGFIKKYYFGESNEINK